jgi:hypothetical protein
VTAVDAGRLARAVHLEAEVHGPGLWVVRGGRMPHRVEREGDRLVCDCVDADMNLNRPCKHVLAVQLRRLPEPIRMALREVVVVKAPR